MKKSPLGVTIISLFVALTACSTIKNNASNNNSPSMNTSNATSSKAAIIKPNNSQFSSQINSQAVTQAGTSTTNHSSQKPDFTACPPVMSNSTFKMFRPAISQSDLESEKIGLYDAGVEIDGHKYIVGMEQTKTVGIYNNAGAGFKGQFSLVTKDMDKKTVCSLPLNSICGGGDMSFYRKNSIDFTMYDYNGDGYPDFIIRSTNINPEIAKKYSANCELLFFEIDPRGKITRLKTSEPICFFDEYTRFPPLPVNKQKNGFYWPKPGVQTYNLLTVNEFIWKNGEFVYKATGTINEGSIYNTNSI